MGLLRFIYFILGGWVLVVCGLWRIDLFHLCCWIYVYRVVSGVLIILMSVKSIVIFSLSLLIFVMSSPSFFFFWSVLPQLKIFSISLEASSLARGLFRNMLLHFQMFGDFPVTFLLLWSEYILSMFSDLLLKFVLWHRTWSILVNVPWILKRMTIMLLLVGCSINVSEIDIQLVDDIPFFILADFL